MKHIPYISFLLIAVLSCFASCEKVELPSSLYEGNGGSDGTTNADVEDMEPVIFDNTWGYNCTIDVGTGELLDSISSDVWSVISGSGTKSNPFSVYAFIGGTVFDAFYSGRVETIDDVWLEGYVVGFVNGRTISKAEFAPGNVATNIILGASADEKNYSRCVPIQLSSSSSYQRVRSVLNLRENPDVLGVKVKVWGKACTYMGCFGMKNVKDCLFE